MKIEHTDVELQEHGRERFRSAFSRVRQQADRSHFLWMLCAAACIVCVLAVAVLFSH